MSVQVEPFQVDQTSNVQVHERIPGPLRRGWFKHCLTICVVFLVTDNFTHMIDRLNFAETPRQVCSSDSYSDVLYIGLGSNTAESTSIPAPLRYLLLGPFCEPHNPSIIVRLLGQCMRGAELITIGLWPFLPRLVRIPLHEAFDRFLDSNTNIHPHPLFVEPPATQNSSQYCFNLPRPGPRPVNTCSCSTISRRTWPMASPLQSTLLPGGIDTIIAAPQGTLLFNHSIMFFDPAWQRRHLPDEQDLKKTGRHLGESRSCVSRSPTCIAARVCTPISACSFRVSGSPPVHAPVSVL